MNYKEPIALITAYEQGKSPIDNIEKMDRFRMLLNAKGMRTATALLHAGESSLPTILVDVNDESEDLKYIQELCQMLRVKYFIYSDANRHSTHHYVDGQTRSLGKLQSIPAKTEICFSNTRQTWFYGFTEADNLLEKNNEGN